uniref:Uncharacterized protein n=1 Tax=Ditylenchus dipsaci TaxID=166011 RepID=A0A915EJH1_9BILA
MDMDQLKQILEAQTNQHALALQQQQQQHQESLAQLVSKRKPYRNINSLMVPSVKTNNINGASSFIKSNISVNGQIVSFILDSAAEVSTISEESYKSIGSPSLFQAQSRADSSMVPAATSRDNQLQIRSYKQVVCSLSLFSSSAVFQSLSFLLTARIQHQFAILAEVLQGIMMLEQSRSRYS